jgi:hypothetical protein
LVLTDHVKHMYRKETVNMAKWCTYARKFIVTGKTEYLRQAMKACDDFRIQTTLQVCAIYTDVCQLADDENAKGHANELARNSYECGYTCCNELKDEGREVEAAIINMVTMRHIVALASLPTKFDAITAKSITSACRFFLEQSRKHEFSECEAFASAMLGKRACYDRYANEACDHLQHAVKLFRKLAAREPSVYDDILAKSLNDLTVARETLGRS